MRPDFKNIDFSPINKSRLSQKEIPKTTTRGWKNLSSSLEIRKKLFEYYKKHYQNKKVVIY